MIKVLESADEDETEQKTYEYLILGLETSQES